MRSHVFTRVAGSQTLLINAFREHRTANASVRLVAIVPQAERALLNRCVFCCQERGGGVVTAAARRTTHPSNYFFAYGTGDFLCPIPPGCQPR